MSKQKLSPEAQAIISAADAGHYATTVALVESFLIDNPTSQRAWLDLGEALGQLALYDEAEKAFQKVIELAGESDSGPIFGEIGNLYRSKSDLNSAIKWYQRQIETDQTDATGLLYLGNVQMRQGNFEAAESSFQKALECESACLEETHFALGLVNRSLGRLSEAKLHFEKAFELDEKFSEAKSALKDVTTAMQMKTPD